MPIEVTEFDAVIPTDGLCSLENALYAAALRSYSRAAEVYGIEEANADIEALLQKYGVETLDTAPLSQREKERVDNDITPVLEEGIARLNLARNLLRLAIVERMSKQSYLATKLDHYDAPGDFDYMGTNWKRMVATSDFTPNEMMAARVLVQLGKLVPTDLELDWSELTSSQQ